MEPKRFFITESIKLARDMTIPDARKYLAGLLELAGEDPDLHDVRDALIHLDHSDRQLELLTRP